MACMDLNWNFALEKDPPGGDIRGMTVGTKEYFDTVFPITGDPDLKNPEI